MSFLECIQLRCPECQKVRDNPRATLQNERGEFLNLVNAIGMLLCDSCKAKAMTLLAQATPPIDEATIRREFGLPRKVPLLEYLDHLEATAKAPSDGTWRRGRGGEVLSDACPATPLYDGQVVAESCPPAERDHILATQPRATLALIAKLREAVQIARDLSLDIIEHSSTGVLVRAAVQAKIDAMLDIEVPE